MGTSLSRGAQLKEAFRRHSVEGANDDVVTHVEIPEPYDDETAEVGCGEGDSPAASFAFSDLRKRSGANDDCVTVVGYPGELVNSTIAADDDTQSKASLGKHASRDARFAEEDCIGTMVGVPDEENEIATFVEVRREYVLVRQDDGREYLLKPDCLIGRGSGANCRILGNRKISREQARVSCGDDRCAIRDLHSANGTFVNGRELGDHEECELHDGDVLTMGEEKFTFTIR